MILSPSESAIPCVFDRMRTCPVNVPSASFSIDRFASASSPKSDRAYKFADKNPQSPSSAASGVRQAMLVEDMMWARSDKKTTTT